MAKDLYGSKGGSGSSHTPVEQDDTAASIATCRMLIALCEGEVPDGQITGKDIFLDGTPLVDADGNNNFDGVTWDFRPGTQDQEVIKGFSAVESEQAVNVTLKKSTPWVIQITDTELDAVVVRMGITGLETQETNGDINGASVRYTIEYSVDGGSYQMYLDKTVTDKLSSAYELSHRVNLPDAKSGWQIRVTRVTDDSTSQRLINGTTVNAITRVIDANLRYPNTALLYVSFSAKAFSSVPKVSVLMKGMIVQVPSNYDPDTRVYTGAWDGSFKWAWTNNPAWIYRDILISTRYGLGNRVTADMVDKWELYKISQRADELVSDGVGGTEPRFMFDAYIQASNSAWQVISDIAAGFNGLTMWGNNMFSVISDMPQDTTNSPIFTAANIVEGKVTQAGGKVADQYSSALVNFSNPDNHYADDTTGYVNSDFAKQFGFRQTTITPIGCARESEAKRRGAWAVISNYFDQTYTFQIGQEGIGLNPGQHIFLADEYVSGKVYGGRVAAVSDDGLTITTDRVTDAVAGDVLKVRVGVTVENVTIKSVSGAAIVVDTAIQPLPGAVFVIDAGQIKLQGMVINKIDKDDDADTYTITGIQYNASKWDAVDKSAQLEFPTISSLPATQIGAPSNLSISQSEAISQNARVVTMHCQWDAPAGNQVISYYNAQWRKDNGDWVNIARSYNRSFDVTGVYSGTYQFRVCAVLTNGVTSVWANSDTSNIVARSGDVPPPTNLAAESKVLSVGLSWVIPSSASDAATTQINFASKADYSDEQQLASVAYPTATFVHSGLASGVTFYYRARLIDKNGYTSAWTDYVKGTSSADASEILSYLAGQIGKTELAQDLTTEIDNKADQDAVNEQIDKTVTQINQSIDDAKTQATNQVTAAQNKAASDLADATKTINETINENKESTNETLNSISGEMKNISGQLSGEINDRQNAVQQEAEARADAILNEQNSRKADINTVKTLIQNGDESLAQQIASVAAGSGDQFDSLDIWYFDDNSSDGWTSSGGAPVITSDGWMTPAVSNDAYVISPSGLGFNSTAYRFIKLRVRKQGSSKWEGELRWKKPGAAFDNTNLMKIPEPVWDENNTATITVNDIAWTGTPTIDQIRLDLTTAVDSKNYIQYDWIAIGRPTPGAGIAALQDEKTARVTADAAEATQRNTLAAQLRGGYDGTDASKVTSGLIFSEQQLRISGDKAEATARQALETKLDGSVSNINKSLDTLNTATKANASDITGLKSSLQTTNNNLANKADASAVNALTTKVNNQGDTITSQGNSITSLNNNLNQVKSSGPNLVIDSGFESYTTTSGSLITDGAHHAGSKSVKFIRVKGTNTDGNQDQDYGGWFDLRSNQVLYIELWCRQDQNSATQKASMNVGIHWQNSTGSNYWPVAFQVNFSELSSDNSWKKFSGYVTVGNDAVKGTFWIAIPQNATNLQGSSLLIDDVFVGDATDGYNAQKSADAAASAVSSLQNTVTSQGNTITSQGSSITNLQNSLNTTNSNLSKKADATALNALQNTVTQQGNSISSQGAQITSLNNQLSNKADSSALSSLQSTVSQQGGNISSQGSRITSLENTVTIGDNIVPNSTMLNNAQGWGGTSVTIDGYPGVYSSSSWSPSSPKFNVTPGDIIDFSIMCKADAAINSLAWGIRFDGPNLNNQTSYVGSANYSSGDKKLVTGTITVPSGATTGQLQPNSGAGIGLTIYNVDVTRRNSGVMANSSAINLLTNKVTTQGDTITSQGNSITTLTNGLKTTNDNVSKKADASALESLSNKVTSQGNTITSQGNSITSLQNSIDATNKNVAAKADASALNSLTTKVNSQGDTISSQGSSITSLNANLNRRTVFTIRAQGNGASGGSNVSSQDGAIVASVGRSYGLVVFQSNSDGHTSIKSSKTYDVFNSSSNGDTLASDIKALDNGTYAAIITYDEPNQNKGSITSAIELLGGTTEVINSLVYRGAYILLGRKGMLAGDGLELKSPTGGNSSAVITTSVEFINGIMQGLGAAGGVMIKADANANAISSLSSTVTSQGDTIKSQGTAITNLNNSLATTNANVNKKADTTALNTLSNTVTSQGNSITAQGLRVTNLEASISVGDNLVPNPDMLNNAKGWSFRSVGVMNGQPYVQSTAGDGWNPTTPKFSVAEGDVLDVSFMARMTGAANGITWSIRFDGDGWTNKTVAVSTDNYAATEHKSVSGTVTAPTGANTAYLQPGQAIPSGNDLMLWDVRITRRSQADTANAKAIDTLTNTVTSQGNSITSIANRTTALETSIKNKADASALSALQSTVTNQGNTITSQGNSITTLTNSVGQQQAKGNNLVTDGGFESYTATSGSLITDVAYHSGSKAVKFRRTAATNSGGNNDIDYGGWFELRSSQVLYVEIWARIDSNSTTQNGFINVGIHYQNQAGQNYWPSAFQIHLDDLPTNSVWKKFSGYVTVGSDAMKGTFWISCPQNASNLNGTSLLLDDVFMCDATDGYNAQSTANAAASAVSSLQNTVTNQGNTISSQSSSITKLQNDLTTTNNNVNTKASTTALNALQSTVTSQGNTITSQGNSINSLNSTVGTNTADIKSTAATVATLNQTVSATWSLKVQTDTNGNKVVAGIGLSSDATGSQFLVQADKFAVITGSNGKIASPFVVTGGQTYLQSALIANASITNAMIGDTIQSTTFSSNSGWQLLKSGKATFSDILINGGTIQMKDSNGVVRVELSSS